MKNAVKSMGLFAVGLFDALIVYPFMHELGHSVTALMVGGRVVEFNIMPIPNILCDVIKVGNTGIVVIGFGGMLIPFFISCIIKVKWFWGWYAGFIVQAISLLSFIIAAVSTVGFIIGAPMPNDDITQILTAWSDGEWICLIISVLLALKTTALLIKARPIQRCIKYFEEPYEKPASAI